MSYDYQETTNDLLKRIDIHSKYGGRNIDEWMLEILPLKPGQTILDVGCGAGKQCFLYHDHLNGQAAITGGDVNAELLGQARRENLRLKKDVTFQTLDFNQSFGFADNTFDLVSCCFAIYYAVDIPFTIREFHRVIKPGGVMFTSGPMPTNKKLFYDIISEATGKTIPTMPGSSRFSTEILSAIQATFAKTELKQFENPLTFESVEPFVEYTRASLSEDRKLWNSFFQTKDDFQRIMSQIVAVAARRLEKDGKLVMTKVVGGILATK